MKLKILIAAAVAAMAVACSTVPTKDIKVTTDADPTVNFGGYQTYGWLASTGMLRDGEGRWTGPPFDIDARIQYLVDQELGKRGITQNSANPELLLVYGIGIDMDNFDLKTDQATNELRLNPVPAGALMIVMVDDRTGALVWVGSATADIQEGANEETMKKRLDYAVNQMFKELPE